MNKKERKKEKRVCEPPQCSGTSTCFWSSGLVVPLIYCLIPISATGQCGCCCRERTLLPFHRRPFPTGHETSLLWAPWWSLIQPPWGPWGPAPSWRPSSSRSRHNCGTWRRLSHSVTRDFPRPVAPWILRQLTRQQKTRWKGPGWPKWRPGRSLHPWYRSSRRGSPSGGGRAASVMRPDGLFPDRENDRSDDAGVGRGRPASARSPRFPAFPRSQTHWWVLACGCSLSRAELACQPRREPRQNNSGQNLKGSKEVRRGKGKGGREARRKSPLVSFCLEGAPGRGGKLSGPRGTREKKKENEGWLNKKAPESKSDK